MHGLLGRVSWVKRSKTGTYPHEELTNRANGPGHRHGDRHVHYEIQHDDQEESKNHHLEDGTTVTGYYNCSTLSLTDRLNRSPAAYTHPWWTSRCLQRDSETREYTKADNHHHHDDRLSHNPIESGSD